MAYRKEEYDAGGHEVVIQQVNEHNNPSAWIDGYAACTNAAMDSLINDSETADTEIADKIAYHKQNDELWKAIKTTLSFMVECHVYYCTSCGHFYDHKDVSSTGFAGHQCGDCARSAATCPDNPNGDTHSDECINPRQKRNARVPTRYKCMHCGRKRKTTPTG